jgi:hypothetical protein
VAGSEGIFNALGHHVPLQRVISVLPVKIRMLNMLLVVLVKAKRIPISPLLSILALNGAETEGVVEEILVMFVEDIMIIECVEIDHV